MTFTPEQMRILRIAERERNKKMKRIVLGLLAFWVILFTAVFAFAQSVEEKLGIGSRIVAPLNYCTTEEAIRDVADLAIDYDNATVKQYMESLSTCSVATLEEYTIFMPLELLDTIQPLNKDMDAFIVKIVIMGVVTDKGVPVLYPEEGWMTVYAMAYRDKDSDPA